MSEAIMAKLGYRSKDVARERVKRSLNSVIKSWPREYHSGFLIHFTNRNLDTSKEYSTMDTEELVLGALFAGNYLGEEVLKLATQLRDSVQRSKRPTTLAILYLEECHTTTRPQQDNSCLKIGFCTWV